MKCGAPHPEMSNYRCTVDDAFQHQFHSRMLKGQWIDWENPDYIPPAPKRGLDLAELSKGVRPATRVGPIIDPRPQEGPGSANQEESSCS